MDGIIFDVDGTLWDSVEVVAESWNLAIKENSDLEPNLNREILQELFGKTMDEIAAGVFPDLDPDSRRKLMDICFDYENRYLETHPGVYYEGVMDTLKELALEYPLFIVSNCKFYGRFFIWKELMTNGIHTTKVIMFILLNHMNQLHFYRCVTHGIAFQLLLASSQSLIWYNTFCSSLATFSMF